MSRPIPPKRYLGDAVSVSVENGMYRLDCEAPPCIIYLEREVMNALRGYVADVEAWTREVDPR